jgi:hypothetical protein
MLLSGGTLTADGDNAGTYNETGGTLTGSGVLAVANNLTWTGGTMSGTGVSDLQPGGTLTIAGSETLNTRTVLNEGIGTWNSTISGDGVGTLQNSYKLSATGLLTGNLTDNGTLYPGGAGMAGGFTLAANSRGGGGVYTENGTLVFDLGASGSASDGISAAVVNLSGSLTLNVLGTPLASSYTLIDDTSTPASTNPVNGTFAGLPEGAIMMVAAQAYQITYVGGDGNDVVINAVTPGGTVVPTVTTVSSSSGTTQVGTAVVITGTNFIGVSNVTFGGTPAVSFIVNSSTQITAIAPAESTGIVDVHVQNAAGTSATVTADQYIFKQAAGPNVTSLSAASGLTSGNTLVDIIGTGFTGATGVSFGSISVTYFQVKSDTSIIATAPAGGAGTVDVKVTTPSGTSSAVSADHYTYTAPATPTITSVSSASGSSAGGTAITISGTGLTGTTEVLFGSVPATTFTVTSDTSILVSSPAQVVGTVDIAIVAPGGTSAPVSADRYTYTLASAPSVSSVSPFSGTTNGGTGVVISGSNLAGATTVLFGSLPAASFTVVNGGTINAIAPPEAAGTVDMTVVTPGGSSAASSSDHYTFNAASAPSVTAVAPSSGSVGGGMQVTISGSGFSGTSGVSFGSVAAASFTLVSDTTIVAVAPPEAAGTVDITVTNQAGTSSTGSADHFTFNSVTPSVTGVTPSSGTILGGIVVTVLGSGFTGASGVSFGSVAAGFSVISDGVITATVPAATATGTLDITVTGPGGTSSTGSADHFTYNSASAPSITGLSTSSLGTAGGTSITITGTGFTSASSVSMGGVGVLNFIVVSDTTIIATVPQIPAGVWDASIVTPAGTSALASADRVTVTAASAPAVTSLGTTSGSTAGGTVVTVSGSGFTAASQVLFGTVPALGFSVISDTSLTATAPAQAAATVDVTVSGPTGSSAVSSSDHFTYNAASSPTVTALSPTSGTVNGGTVVQITGTNFTSASAVSFGSVAATSFSVISSTTIVAVQPTGTATGNVYVTVTTGGGTSSTGSASQFNNTADTVPSITALSPSSAPVGGPTAVTITGSHFTGATSVYSPSFGGISFTVLSDTIIVCTLPFDPHTGSVNLSVTTPSGTSSTSAFTFQSLTQGAPTVTGLSVSSGPTGGGTFVIVSGTGFTSASAVKFGGLTTPNWNVLSDTQLTVTAPTVGPPGTLDVTVTNSGGTSSTSSADKFTYSTGSAVSVPTITSLGTTSGSTAGGTSVAITGTNFTSASAVTFGGIAAASFTVNSSTSITATSPPAPAGTIDVQVTGPGGTSATGSADHFTYNLGSVPAVTSLSSGSGSTGGGASVTITGTNFTGATGVTVGGVPAPSFTINSATSITVTMPAQTAGTFDVQVSSYAGTSALASADQYAISAASAPAVSSLGTSSGTTAGGTSVTITGTNFTGATGVTFGGVPASSFTVNSSTSITAVSPPEAAATVDIIVATPSGTSPAVSADHFTVSNASAPTVTAVSPTSGTTAGGTAVTITGTNFTGSTGVSFGSTAAASFVVNSSTSITAVSPPEAAATIDITVTTYAGTSGTSSSDHYTYSAATAPSVTAVTPSSGSAAGGVVVAVSGSHFTGASAVNFGTAAALSFTVQNDNSIIAVSPSLSAATYDITVVTPSSTSSTGSADHFTANAVSLPTVTSVSPTSASTGGGAIVLVGGTGFTSASAVTFGTLPAAGFTVYSDTLISAIVPPGPAGTIDVTVTNYTGTSALSSGDRFTLSAASTPAVTSVSPTSGTSGGGTIVTVSGNYFTGASAVNFGTLSAASFTVLNDSTILAVAPPQAAATYDITVTTPTGTSAVGSSDHYTYNAATAPSITSVSPSSGTSAGGTVVSVTGSYFTGASAVAFGTLAASWFTVVSDTQIIAVSPPEAAATYDIRVTTPSGTSATGSSDHFTVSAASTPSVSAVTPSSGTSGGGTVVTVTGSAFTGASAVKFGSTAAAWFIVNSDTSVTADAPPGTAGTVDITITTPSGTSSTGSADHYTYTGSAVPTVTAVSPSSGGSSGGTAVTLTGTGFTSAAGVYFGSVAAVAFSVISDTSLVAVAPPEPAATVDITVTNNIGTSSTGSADHFTYNAASAPTVTAIAPSTGTSAGQAMIMLTGTHFTGASAVKFGTVPAVSFTILSDTSILAISPPQAAATNHITVTTPSGTSSTSSSDQITVSAASNPTVTAVTPTSGSTGGGTVAYVSGSNFTGATGVSFGATAAASFTILSDTLIEAVAPPHTSGTIDITVTTYAATSSTGSADHFTYNSAGTPSVTQITPTEGSTAGGVVVTVLGSAFTGASGVSFGGTAATSYTVVNDSTILATAPAESAATVDITVTTPSGTSSTGSADKFTYAVAPTVTAVSPTSGTVSGGTSVSITGTNFFSTVWVYFGTVLATSVTYNSSTSLTAVSPAESAGTVDITVQTEVGVSATSSSDHYTFTSPQYFAGPPKTTGHAAALTMKQLALVVAAAERDLQAAGYNIAPLNGVTFHITCLAAPLLGMEADNTIWIDSNAEGYGWYTGISAAAFSRHVAALEYAANPSSPASRHVDLLTVVMHELGHVLGFPSIDPAISGHDWMTATLGTGTRRLPDPARLTFDPSSHESAFATGAALASLNANDVLSHRLGRVGPYAVWGEPRQQRQGPAM